MTDDRFPGYGPGPTDEPLAAGGRGTWDYGAEEDGDPEPCFGCAGTGTEAHTGAICRTCGGQGVLR
jgi:hypothetical protein